MTDVSGSGAAEQRIVIEFRDKARNPARTEYMPHEDAAAAFEALAQALEQAGPEGDRWIRAGKCVVVRASEVHNIGLEDYVDLARLYESGGGDFYDRRF